MSEIVRDIIQNDEVVGTISFPEDIAETDINIALQKYTLPTKLQTRDFENGYLNGEYDYIKFRDKCKSILVPIFDTLSDEEKGLLIKYYIYPNTVSQETINSFYTEEEQKQNWNNLLIISKRARQSRWTAAKGKVSFMLDVISTCDLFQAIEILFPRYIEASRPDLILWVMSSTYVPLGIDYSTTGFAQKTYYSEEIRDALYAILITGIY